MPPVERARVAYVLKRYPRLSETFILTEILAHEAAGLDLEIFSLRPPTEGRFHEALARVRAPVTYLPYGRLRASELWSSIHETAAALPSTWRELPSLERADTDTTHQSLLLARLAAERGITHLHAHFGTAATSVARAVSRITGIPYSFTAHAKDIFHEDVDREALRLKLRDASSVVTVSDYNVDFLRRMYGDDTRVVRRIYNGLDLSEFSYATPERRPPLILGVGRLVEKKGFEVLVDACGTLRDRGIEFTCNIIGDGERRNDLEARIADRALGRHVVLTGPRSRGEVIDAMREASVLAAPCVVGEDGNQDGLPTVLLEAMALGTPCVSTDVTGIPELVRDGVTGALVPAGEASPLAARLALLLESAERRVALAEAARTLIEREFDIRENTVELRGLFANGSPARRPADAEAVA